LKTGVELRRGECDCDASARAPITGSALGLGLEGGLEEGAVVSALYRRGWEESLALGRLLAGPWGGRRWPLPTGQVKGGIGLD
jgi:hypothetical protein